MHQQCFLALERANEVRAQRSRIKRDLKTGALDPRDLLLGEVPEVLRRLAIGEFLTWCPRVGRLKATAIMRGVVGPSIPLGRISLITRTRVAERLPRLTARRAA